MDFNSKPDLPLVSVIVPVYNAEKYLEQCVDSLCAQTYKNLEIILVDDCSPDSSPAICDKYAQNDSRVTVIHREQNGRISAARNSGNDAANGKWLMYVDADDWIDPNTCEEIVEQLEQTGADVAVWNYISEYDDISKPKTLFEQTVFLEHDDYSAMFRRVISPTDSALKAPELIHSLSTVWNKMFRASLIKDNGIAFVDISTVGSEDLMYCIECMNKAVSCVVLKGHYYHYRRATGISYTSRSRDWLFDAYLRLYDSIEQVCLERADCEACLTALDCRRVLSLVTLGFNELARELSTREKIRNLRKMMSEPKTRLAAKQLPLRFFPLHWKVFYICVKFRFALCIYVLLKTIKLIIAKRD